MALLIAFMPGVNARRNSDCEYQYGTFFQEDILRNLRLACPGCEDQGPEWPSMKDKMLHEMTIKYKVSPEHIDP